MCVGRNPGLTIDDDIAQGREVQGQSWEDHESAIWRRVGMKS